MYVEWSKTTEILSKKNIQQESNVKSLLPREFVVLAVNNNSTSATDYEKRRSGCD